MKNRSCRAGRALQPQDARFPVQTVRYFLESHGLTLAAGDAVVYYKKSLLTFERLLETHLGAAPAADAPSWPPYRRE